MDAASGRHSHAGLKAARPVPSYGGGMQSVCEAGMGAGDDEGYPPVGVLA